MLRPLETARKRDRKTRKSDHTKNMSNDKCDVFHTNPSTPDTDWKPKNVSDCERCCEDFSTYFPYSFNIFLPGTKNVVRDFVVSRHRLTVYGLHCRLRMGLNTFDNGCTHGKERILRVESMSKEELIQCVDLLDSIFPKWKVWKKGKTDSDLL